jgi:hypothetical protein
MVSPPPAAESLAGSWTPPLQLSPVTSDVDEATERLEAFEASGVQGLVVGVRVDQVGHTFRSPTPSKRSSARSSAA